MVATQILHVRDQRSGGGFAFIIRSRSLSQPPAYQPILFSITFSNFNYNLEIQNLSEVTVKYELIL